MDSTKTLSPEVRFQDSFAQANIHLLKGDNAKAVACLVNCLKINPSSSDTNFQLARVYYLDRNYDVALNYALKAHHLKPDNRWYSRFTALVYEQLNDYDKAKKFFQYFLNSDPTYDDYESFYSFQLDFGKIDDAIATLDKMETLFGYQTLYSLHRAELFTQKNDIDRAAEEYKRLIRTDSTNLSAYGLLEELYYNHGKLSEAQEVQKRIARIDPNNPLSHLSQAMLCRTSGQKDCFYENLVESFKSDKITIKDKLLIISDIFNDNKIFDEDKVETLFQTLNDFFPESALVHSNFADFYLFVNKPDQALEQLELAVKHNLSDYKNFHTIFQLYFICEDYEGLRKFVDNALEMFPDVAEVYMYSAVADMGLKKFDDASDGFSNARDFGIEFSPVANDYRFYFGLYNYLLKNKKVAFDYFDKYFNAGELDWYFTLRYVYCLVDSRENLKRAESLLTSLDKEHHKYYYYYYVSAYYKYVKGDVSGAKTDIATALRLEPDKQSVQALAAEIDKM
jgi:tetratricopeptide (TPR) repeat protein